MQRTVEGLRIRRREADRPIAPTFLAMCARLRVSAVVSAVLLPIVVIVAYARARIEHGVPTDYRLFGPTGADILSGHWNLVYADPQNMGGPFQLVPFGIARLLDVQAVLPWTIFYTCAITLLVFVFCVLVPVSGRSGEVRWMFWVTFVVAGAAVVANFIPSAVYGGHPAEMMVPLLWIVAAGLAKDQRFATAGIVIGISAGFESWGILGAVLIFVAVKPRVVRAAISCILTIAVVYGPFAATGVFRLFGFHWHVSSGSAWGLLFPHLTSFPWSLRVVQALVATIAGFVVARLTRSTWYAIWLAPLAIVGARLLLDPLLFGYYWIAAATVALSALAALVSVRQWIPAGVAAALAIWFWFPGPEPLVSVAVLVVVVVALTATVTVARGRESRAVH